MSGSHGTTDAARFIAVCGAFSPCPVKTHTTALPLSQANEALDRLRRGDLTGALVLVPD